MKFNPAWDYSHVVPASTADVTLLEAHLWNEHGATLMPDLVSTWECKTLRNLLRPGEYVRTIGIVLWGRHRAVAPLKGATDADLRALLAGAPSVYRNLRTGHVRGIARSTQPLPERYHRYTRYAMLSTIVDEQTGLMQLAESADDFTQWSNELKGARERTGTGQS